MRLRIFSFLEFKTPEPVDVGVFCSAKSSRSSLLYDCNVPTVALTGYGGQVFRVHFHAIPINRN